MFIYSLRTSPWICDDHSEESGAIENKAAIQAQHPLDYEKLLLKTEAAADAEANKARRVFSHVFLFVGARRGRITNDRIASFCNSRV